MSDLLLTTKFTLPTPRPNLVNRGRLIEQLNKDFYREESFLRKLTLVSAPAGYGKTTLIADWLSQIQGKQDQQTQNFPQEKGHRGLEVVQLIQIAWLSLDEGENDPIRFFLYLVSCLAKVDATLPLIDDTRLQPGQASSLSGALTKLINQLAEVQNPIILALDDYHLITNPSIHQHLTFLLDHLPPRIHLVILTREDPLLPVARLRASGEVLEIRQEHLRFTRDEIIDFLSNRMGLVLRPDEIASLERRTEGWIAGLQLAALSMQGREDLSVFIQAFTGSSRFILDYLVEEVYERQPDEIKEFLLRTSILERLTPSLCDAISPNPGSHSILESLEQDNLFIVALDQSRTWYRYHRLFSELLKHRLRTTRPGLENELHQSASKWYQEQGLVDQAIHHAKAARDWDHASILIQSVLTEYLKQGQVITLINWYQMFPQDYLQANPRLWFDACWPLLVIGHYDEAEPILMALEPAVKGHPAFLGEIYTAQAYLARGVGDHRRMMERSQLALEYLSQESLVSRSIVTLNLGLAYWHNGQMEEAAEALSEAYQTAKTTGNLYAALTATIFQGRVHAVRGQLYQAEEIFNRAIQQGGEMPILALAYMDIATLQYEWDQLESCEVTLQKAISISKNSQNDEFLVGCLLLVSRLKIAQGDLDGAKGSLLDADGLINKGGIPEPMTRRVDAAWGYYLANKRGRYTAPTRDVPEHYDSHSFYRFVGVTRARALQLREAMEYLEDLGERALENGWAYALVGIRTLQASLTNNREAGLAYLQEALGIGESGGFIRSFLEAGGNLSSLLEEAASKGPSASYASVILGVLKDQGSGDGPSLDPFGEALTERELEVLDLLSQGLSNREIAMKLVISTGTAKSHVHNLCGKMGVRNRTEAAMKGKELNLI